MNVIKNTRLLERQHLKDEMDGETLTDTLLSTQLHPLWVKLIDDKFSFVCYKGERRFGKKKLDKVFNMSKIKKLIKYLLYLA